MKKQLDQILEEISLLKKSAIEAIKKSHGTVFLMDSSLKTPPEKVDLSLNAENLKTIIDKISALEKEASAIIEYKKDVLTKIIILSNQSINNGRDFKGYLGVDVHDFSKEELIMLLNILNDRYGFKRILRELP